MAIKQQQVFNIFTLHGSATNALKPNRFLKLTATGTEYADEGDIAVGVGMYFPNSSAEYESGELVSAVTGLIFVEAAEAILRGAKIAVGVDGRAKNAGSGDVTVGFSDSAATAASQKILFIPAFGAGVPTESAGEWGSITGDISDQEDLQLELDNKETNRSIEVITSTIDYAITTAVDNRTYEIDTEGNSIILTIPDSTDDAVHFKILLADSVGGGDITVVTATGQLIGGQTSQAIQLNQKGFEVTEITDAYSITQDSRAAIPSSSLEFFATNTTDPVLTTYLQSVTNTDDSRYTTVTTKQSAAITTTNQITGQFITDAGAVIGVLNEGSISLVAELRKNLAVQKDISIYMKLFKRDSGGTETELAQSDTMVVSNDTTYSAYTFSMLLPVTTVANTDRFVVKSYSTAVGAGQDPILETELMGTNPTRLILPITQSSIAHNSIPGRSVTDAHPQSAITNLVADLALKADLVGGKILSSQLPSIAITDFLGTFADLTIALADSGVQASQKGDWFSVTGVGSYIVTTTNPTTVSDVQIILVPANAVQSVNGYTGVVEISATDIDDFDTEVANNSAVVLNTAKETNATHTGEVTGSSALTIADNVVDEANLKLDTTPTNDYVLTADDTASGGMKWAKASGGGGGTVQDGTSLAITPADEGTTAGNARGTYAVDLQTYRSSATQVASGEGSGVLSGINNKASGYYAVANGGHTNTASGNMSGVNSGISNIASGVKSNVNGGDTNIVAAESSNINGGSFNIIPSSDYYSTIGGGRCLYTKFIANVVPGGYNATQNKTRQFSYGTLQVSTTDATQTEMFIYGSNRINIDSNNAYGFTIDIVGLKSDASAGCYFTRRGMIHNDGGTTALIGSVQTIGTDINTLGGGSVSITADNTNDALVVKVTGVASTTIQWQAKVAITQVEI